MKISASPLVVAVALGLLGPLALTPDSDDAEVTANDADGVRDSLTTTLVDEDGSNE